MCSQKISIYSTITVQHLFRKGGIPDKSSFCHDFLRSLTCQNNRQRHDLKRITILYRKDSMRGKHGIKSILNWSTELPSNGFAITTSYTTRFEPITAAHFDQRYNKKAQLTQRERATPVHVWRPTANKCKIRKNLYFSAQGHSSSLLSVSIETRVWLPISD